jgi:hypothetical protein
MGDRRSDNCKIYGQITGSKGRRVARSSQLVDKQTSIGGVTAKERTYCQQ